MYTFPGPTFPAKPLLTPFGTINLPEMGPISIGKVNMNPQRMEALKHAFAADLAAVFGAVPYVGSVVGDKLANMHLVEIRNKLTDSEYNKFLEDGKTIPGNSITLIHSFME